jgi:hypothetical protein
MRNIVKIVGFVLAMAAGSVQAEYRMIVPQAPGGGTSVWASIVAKHLEKHLGEKIVIQHIPGVKDIPGMNEFHNKLRTDPKTIMVSHGGNGVSYLVDQIDYDYKHYDSIGMQNLNIVVGHSDKTDPARDRIKIAGGAGLEPDGMAIAMLVCGNLPKKEDYLVCWKKHVTWVNGIKGSERRLAYQRGELNTVRETPAAWIKHYANKTDTKIWYHHGVLDLATGQQQEDPNFPAGFRFETVFQRVHGAAPRGEFYEAYALVRNFRDVLQKALWVNKGNPNTEKLRTALKKMLQDPEAVKALEADSGRYSWIVGTDGNRVVDQLRKNITEKNLQTLVWWHDSAYQFKSVYKPNLVIR